MNKAYHISSNHVTSRGGVLEDVLGLEDVLEDTFLSSWPWPQRSSPWPRSLKSSKICPVLGSKTALFFKPLKLCITIIINGQRCKRIRYRWVNLPAHYVDPIWAHCNCSCYVAVVLFGYWSNSESLPASLKYSTWRVC